MQYLTTLEGRYTWRMISTAGATQVIYKPIREEEVGSPRNILRERGRNRDGVVKKLGQRGGDTRREGNDEERVLLGGHLVSNLNVTNHEHGTYDNLEEEITIH